MTDMENLQTGELPIDSEGDLVACRKLIRQATTEAGFGVTDVTRIVTAVSELARNIFVHADSGVMRWNILRQSGKIGIELVFEDKGAGIADVEQALTPGFSTVKSLGMGLPGVKRLMDEMTIKSEAGTGSVVTVRKWARVR